jgi:hypothetical protein
MKSRYVDVSPEFFVMQLSTAPAWKITKNILPEDVTLDRMEVIEVGPRKTIRLWVKSAVFKATDPDALPGVHFTQLKK